MKKLCKTIRKKKFNLSWAQSNFGLRAALETPFALVRVVAQVAKQLEPELI